MCYSHACFECDNQVDNNNENTECNFQLCWNAENETEFYNQSNTQINWVWDHDFMTQMSVSWQKKLNWQKLWKL